MAESSGFIERDAALAPLAGQIVFTVEAHSTQEVNLSKPKYAQRLPTDQPSAKQERRDGGRAFWLFRVLYSEP
jgi:hypothetical protein